MYFKFPMYFGILFITLVLGCRRWRQLKRADKMLVLLVGLTILQEIVAYGCYKVFRNNMFTYHVYSPIEFFVICLFFNEQNKILKQNNIGIGLGIIGILAGISNTVFLQPLNVFNSYYLLFEGTMIILLCLLSLYSILINDNVNFKMQSFFWVTLALMFYWSITYTGWGVFSFIDMKKKTLYHIYDIVIYVSNLMFYSFLSIILFNYKKLNYSVT